MSEQELPQECCAKCRFWDFIKKAGFTDPDELDDKWWWSHCRRFPPVAPVANACFWADGVPLDSPSYPLTQDDDWCGEFQPRQPNTA